MGCERMHNISSVSAPFRIICVSHIVHFRPFLYNLFMTKRLDNCVVRGELDNRIPGRVSGMLWLNGVAKPVELELKGDTMRDLAGEHWYAG